MMLLNLLSLIIVGDVVFATSIPEVNPNDQPINPEENDGFYQGDIKLTEEQEHRLNERKLTSLEVELWPGGAEGVIVPYSTKAISEALKRSAIEDGISHWEENTCIKFKDVTGSEDSSDHYLAFISDTGCYSYIGKINRLLPSQDISIGKGCTKLGIVAHEIGHALGYNHEQSRSDRDTYVEVIGENIIPGRETNFNKVVTNDNDLPYDPTSVMHYSATAFSKNGMLTLRFKKNVTNDVFIGQRDGLSFYDIKLANIVYKCIDNWLAACKLTADPCINEGFTGRDCKCVCRPGTTGSLCENNNRAYLDAMDDSKSTVKRDFITSPQTVQSIPIFDKDTFHAVHITAPKCHVVKFTVTQFKVFRKSANIIGGDSCNYEFLEVRDDMSQKIGNISCGSEIAPGTSFTSHGQNMVLFSKLRYFTPFSKWAGIISFENVCDSNTIITPDVTVTSMITAGTCSFVKIGKSYYFRNPNYPSPSHQIFRCSIEFIADVPSTYQLSVDEFSGSESTIMEYWQPRRRYNRFTDGTSGIYLASSGGKLYVSSRSLKDSVLFSLKLTPMESKNKKIILTEGKPFVLTHGNNLAGISTEYMLRAPRGRRIQIHFTEFNIGNSQSARYCSLSNALVIARSADELYSSHTDVFCLNLRSALGKTIESENHGMNLYVRSPHKIIRGFQATVTVI